MRINFIKQKSSKKISYDKISFANLFFVFRYILDIKVPLMCLYDNQNPISGVDCICPLRVKYFNRTGLAVRLYWNLGWELSTDLEQIRSTIRVDSVISIVPLHPGLELKSCHFKGLKYIAYYGVAKTSQNIHRR